MTHDSVKTPLYQLHQELGAHFVDFAGYMMPIHYQGQGAIQEHLHCRKRCGLFDISHMGQFIINGTPQTLEAIQTARLDNLPLGMTRYALLTNAQGGIIDDVMISRIEENQFFLVVNAARKQKDEELITRLCGRDNVRVLANHGLLALQGPRAEAVMICFIREAADLRFMQTAQMKIDGADCRISRLGYTGEDGYEISAAASDITAIARILLAHEDVAPMGLGARDSLRLEAGLCLYGNDIDETVTPIEAGLAFALGASRGRHRSTAAFPGAARIFAQQEKKSYLKKRVGLKIAGRIPLRTGAEISHQGSPAGVVTSGGYSPCLEMPIAMGYVTRESAKNGQELHSEIRGKPVTLTVCDPVFVPHRYQR